MLLQLARRWSGNLPRLLLIALAGTATIPSCSQAGVTSASLQCQYSFLAITNLIQDASCTLQPITVLPQQPAPPIIPTSPQLSTGPLTAAQPTSANPWSYTLGWVYNPIFSCCSFSPGNTTPSNNETSNGTSVASNLPTLITSVDLSGYASLIDEGQQQLELSVSYYTSDDGGPSSSSAVPSADTFQAVVRFLDANGVYMIAPGSGSGSGVETGEGYAELNSGDAESLLYFAFDAVTLNPTRVPVGARGLVLQILVPGEQTSFCFDYFALRLEQGTFHPTAESLLQKLLIAMGSVVLLNAALIPVILFYGLPGWLWRSAPVNFFQKNPVADHHVPLALFISTCQWIYNIILQYFGGSSYNISIIHSSQALWLVPLVLIGTFFASAFVHWALFLCYNQVMQQPRQQYHAKPRRWRAPLLGLWAALCLLLARVGIVVLGVVEGGYWSVPIGILLAVPETVAMILVIVFFIRTMWRLFRNGLKKGYHPTGINSGGITGGGIAGIGGVKKGGYGVGLSRSSSMTPLWDSTGSSSAVVLRNDTTQDDLVNLSSFHHRAYVKSLLHPERDLKDAAGSMYGQSTIGSDKASSAPYNRKIPAVAVSSASTKSGEESSRYIGSTLNTTFSMASSSGTEYSRHATEFDFNVSRDGVRPPPLSPSAGFEHGRQQFPFEQSGQHAIYGNKGRRGGGGGGGGVSTAPSEKSTSAPASSLGGNGGGSGHPPMYTRPKSSREGLSVHKLTWNSATTSYTATSAAQPMTGVAPTPSIWEYIAYPKRHIWPSVVGIYLLIVRLPLRILVAVMTTLVLCYDVLLSIGAAETVLAVPVSCLLGGMAYPGPSQFDNTMNVARAMHTVNLVLVVVLLPAVVVITMLHQIRMVQKYNWCLRLLRIGNYGFVPGGREYTQHLKHPVRFIGYTVGFGVVGLCFTIFLLFTICTVMAMLLVAATFRSSIFRNLGSRAVGALGISCLLVLILWIVQMLVIRYRFRMPGSRFLLSSQGSTRVSFHHWEFFWAFFNIVFGAFSFFKRIILSVLSMGIYSTRIDLCIMGGQFRPWDGGYSAFVGLVLADHVLNNPIMLEFVQILRDLLLVRRNPHLAHHFLEAIGRSESGDITQQDQETRERRLMMMMSPQQRARGIGGSHGPLNDIDEREETRMDDLLMATNSGGGIGAGLAVKGGAVVPEVSRIHHYFRIDQRIDRHGPGQGPRPSSSSQSPPPAYNQNNNVRSSAAATRVYTPLLATADDNKPRIHVKMQNAHMSPESAVSQEQIRQKLSEARLRSIRVRNRWFLYVTLARNPSLRSLRRTKASDFLYPIAYGPEYAGSHQEEVLMDIQWDRGN